MDEMNWSSSATLETAVFLSRTSGLPGRGAGMRFIILSATSLPMAFNSGV